MSIAKTPTIPKPRKKPFIKMNTDEAHALNCKLRSLAPAARELYRYLQTVLPFPDKKFAASNRMLATKLKFTMQTISAAKFALWDAELIYLHHRTADRMTVYQMRTTWEPTDKPDRRTRYLDKSANLSLPTCRSRINGSSVFNKKDRQDVIASMANAAEVRAAMSSFLEASIIPEKHLSYTRSRVSKDIDPSCNVFRHPNGLMSCGNNTYSAEVILRSKDTAMREDEGSQAEETAKELRRVSSPPSASAGLVPTLRVLPETAATSLFTSSLYNKGDDTEGVYEEEADVVVAELVEATPSIETMMPEQDFPTDDSSGWVSMLDTSYPAIDESCQLKRCSDRVEMKGLNYSENWRKLGAETRIDPGCSAPLSEACWERKVEAPDKPDAGTELIIDGGIRRDEYFNSFVMSGLVHQERAVLDGVQEQYKGFYMKKHGPKWKTPYAYLPLNADTVVGGVDEVLAIWMQAKAITSGIMDNFVVDNYDTAAAVSACKKIPLVIGKHPRFFRKAIGDIFLQCRRQAVESGTLLLMMILYLESGDTGRSSWHSTRPALLSKGFDEYLGRAGKVLQALPREERVYTGGLLF